MSKPERLHLISERGRALIIAADVLDRSDGDPDGDIAILARQLQRAQEEIEILMGDVKRLRIIRP